MYTYLCRQSGMGISRAAPGSGLAEQTIAAPLRWPKWPRMPADAATAKVLSLVGGGCTGTYMSTRTPGNDGWADIVFQR